MSDNAGGESRPTGETEVEAKAARKAQSERLNQIMWAYICGAITLISSMVGLGATFIPLGFGVLGCVLAWQLMRKGERLHGSIAGAILWGGILIWLTANGSWIAVDLRL
ncbi:MAG TPA: hypothetical protein VNF99_10095 [Stellaceae bacterium]|nr:hypothetical protein [Stellaceae bacterium]